MSTTPITNAELVPKYRSMTAYQELVVIGNVKTARSSIRVNFLSAPNDVEISGQRQSSVCNAGGLAGDYSTCHVTTPQRSLEKNPLQTLASTSFAVFLQPGFHHPDRLKVCIRDS